MTIEKIKERHQPIGQYRISPYRYESGTSFTGRARAGWIYCLAGECSFNFGNVHKNLVADDIWERPAGKFEFKAKVDTEIVLVWKLPEAFWKSE